MKIILGVLGVVCLTACGPPLSQWPVYSPIKGQSSLSGKDTLTVAARAIAITGLGVEPAVSGTITSQPIEQSWTGEIEENIGHMSQGKTKTKTVTTKVTMRIVFAALSDGSWTLGISCLSLLQVCSEDRRSELMIRLQTQIKEALASYTGASIVTPDFRPSPP